MPWRLELDRGKRQNVFILSFSPVAQFTESALFLQHWLRYSFRHTQLNRSQKHTVVAQGVIDRLHARYTDIESSAITRYGHKASLTKVEFIRVMVDLKLLLTSTEVRSQYCPLPPFSFVGSHIHHPPP
jgi:hypothetical protein